MRKEFLNRLTIATNRSIGQTQFLLELLNGDIFKLMELEEKLKNNFLFYCPGDEEECETVLSMDNDSEWFKLTFTKEYRI